MGTIDSIKSAIGDALRPVRGSESRLALHKVGASPSLPLSSSAFQPGGPISPRHAREGEDVSPPLSWGDLPAGTVSIALLCEDPDAPTPQPFVHWLVYALPPTATQLPEAMPEGAAGFLQGKNSLGHCYYDGPDPPPGHGVHHYHFQLFALDREITANVLDRNDLVEAMRGHVIAAGELVGLYER